MEEKPREKSRSTDPNGTSGKTSSSFQSRFAEEVQTDRGLLVLIGADLVFIMATLILVVLFIMTTCEHPLPPLLIPSGELSVDKTTSIDNGQKGFGNAEVKMVLFANTTVPAFLQVWLYGVNGKKATLFGAVVSSKKGVLPLLYGGGCPSEFSNATIGEDNNKDLSITMTWNGKSIIVDPPNFQGQSKVDVANVACFKGLRVTEFSVAGSGERGEIVRGKEAIGKILSVKVF